MLKIQEVYYAKGKNKKSRCKRSGSETMRFYFAYSTARLSRMTLTLISPG